MVCWLQVYNIRNKKSDFHWKWNYNTLFAKKQKHEVDVNTAIYKINLYKPSFQILTYTIKWYFLHPMKYDISRVTVTPTSTHAHHAVQGIGEV